MRPSVGGGNAIFWFTGYGKWKNKQKETGHGRIQCWPDYTYAQKTNLRTKKKYVNRVQRSTWTGSSIRVLDTIVHTVEQVCRVTKSPRGSQRRLLDWKSQRSRSNRPSWRHLRTKTRSFILYVYSSLVIVRSVTYIRVSSTSRPCIVCKVYLIELTTAALEI